VETKNQWNKTDQWDEEIELIKSIISKSSLVETTKWGGPVYTLDNKNVLGVGAFKSYVGIWFYQGALLKDEAGVLISANEGVTKSLRQWRFANKQDILKNESLILKYISEAIENQLAGLSLKPEKKPESSSAILDLHMQQDPQLADAFSSLTPGKRREYIEHLESAKREETKLSRLEKIKPMILQGIGLHDKYKK
jgi:uncharacterized protein YdeI (YjbR/CyaY-like superfamily)